MTMLPFMEFSFHNLYFVEYATVYNCFVDDENNLEQVLKDINNCFIYTYILHCKM